MIKEVTMYTVICDNCGKDCNKDQEYSCWSDKTFAQDCAMESDWLKEGDEHYCTECYSYNDEDELVIDKSRTNTNS